MFEPLTEDECWSHLAAARVGRFAVDSGRGPQIFPVNHTVHDGIITFRTGPGEKVMDSWAHPRVAFEVDGQDGEQFWSVVVEGESTIRATNDPLVSDGLESFVTEDPTPKHMVISIRADRISGRRLSSPPPASIWAAPPK